MCWGVLARRLAGLTRATQRGSMLPGLGVGLVIDVPEGSAVGRVENDIWSNASNAAVAEQEVVISAVATGRGEIIEHAPAS